LRLTHLQIGNGALKYKCDPASKPRKKSPACSGSRARRLAAITAYDYDLQRDSERCLEAGMDGYISKIVMNGGADRYADQDKHL